MRQSDKCPAPTHLISHPTNSEAGKRLANLSDTARTAAGPLPGLATAADTWWPASSNKFSAASMLVDRPRGVTILNIYRAIWFIQQSWCGADRSAAWGSQTQNEGLWDRLPHHFENHWSPCWKRVPVKRIHQMTSTLSSTNLSGRQIGAERRRKTSFDVNDQTDK